ncbi:MAG: N-6 DNA methylase [Thermodesulfobacteriota bacterium]
MLPSRLAQLEKIEARAPALAEKIHAMAQAAANEAEFRRPFANLIEDIGREFDIPILVREEYSLAQGRADAAYNRLIIEYENPGSLRPSLTHRHTAHAVQQVKDYMEGVAREERQQLTRLAGVAVDGRHFIFVRHVDDDWRIEPPVPVNHHTTTRFLKLLFSLVSGKALIPKNLIDDFGSQNLTAQRITRALNRALAGDLPPLVQTLLRQWATFFGEVSGYEEGSARLRDKPELKKFARGMGIDPGQADPPRLFFAVHTYFALLIKFIAWLALSRFVSPWGGGPNLVSLSQLESEELRRRLWDMEKRGAIFKTLGIRNFLEADFFGWYLETWTPEIEAVIRLLLERLADYDPGTLEVSPEQARDLLKKLYHTLMPRELRHDLGEYYTPDWLAQRVLDMLEGGRFKGDPKKKLLDPACGSGTFLVLAIQRIKEYCQSQGFNERDTLEAILANVAGIDLNPLAVIAARTNYILALGDLLPHRQREIDLPVYLADSILTPAEGKGLFGHASYPIKTTAGTFEVPSVLKSREQIEALANLLEECIDSGTATATFLARLEKRLSLPGHQWGLARPLLEKLYEQFQDLHAKGQDGIWSRILKNAFMPLFLKDFDYIVGNPPWVNWESLPEEYRQDTKKLWVHHGLFPHGGMDTILGKGKKDISMLMTYEAMESFLKNGGRLAFIITQTVFKGAGAGQGFRRFKLGDGTPIRPIHVDDMSYFQPFEGATNRTAVVVLQKGRSAKYPLPYTLWQKTVSGRSIGYDSDLEEVTAMTRRINMQAEPVKSEDITSSWLTARPKALKALRKLLGPSDYKAHEGVNTGGANGVFWLEIIAQRPDGMFIVRNITEGAKRQVEQVTADIEPDFIYPLLRNRDVQRWRAYPSAHILMVQDPKTRQGIDAYKMQAKYPRTWAYLNRFEDVLRARKSQAVRRLMEKGPFYSMFSVGDYTFKPYKVIWPNMGDKAPAAVISKNEHGLILPQHIVTLVGLDNPEEAYYICSLVNSCIFILAANAFSQHGGKSFGDPHILETIRIMAFDKGNEYHVELANLAQKAHDLVDMGNMDRLNDLENEVDEIAATLWGITSEELKDIRWNLADLKASGQTLPTEGEGEL